MCFFLHSTHMRTKHAPNTHQTRTKHAPNTHKRPGELWGDEELEPAASLDGVVTVVDAANAARQLAEARAEGAANEAQLQVALADVILVNKVCGL